LNASPPSRGASSNPATRFQELELEPDADWYDPEDRGPRTRFYRDHSSTVIAYNDSPDIPFDASVNPYRGCEHGCIYCYARPTHEYLGFSAGLDFESRIMVKEDAPELLRAELSSPKWKPRYLAMCGVTDAYQVVERKLRLTRRCLEVLAEFRNPVGIITKNAMVARDADVLADLAHDSAAMVMISITTMDEELRKVMEPRASPIAARLSAVRTLAGAGVPVGVMVAPVIPGLTDHEAPAILKAAADAGASFAGYVLLRLPLAVGPLFEHWLGEHFPLRKEKVLNQLKAMRGGKLNDPRFGSRMRGSGTMAKHFDALFKAALRRTGLDRPPQKLSTAAFRRPSGPQLDLFQ
jgi:DNA repair photolyase